MVKLFRFFFLKSQKPLMFFNLVFAKLSGLVGTGKERINKIQFVVLSKMQSVKKKIENVTGYNWDTFSDALTISSLLTIFTKILFILLFSYKIKFQLNLLLLLLFFLFSVYSNLIFYFREFFAQIINLTISEKVKYKDGCFNQEYYEEDAFRDDEFKYEIPHNIYNIMPIEDLNYYILNYKKNNKYKYVFKEPHRNIMNVIMENIYIFFVFLRLIVLYMPKTFFIIKTVLFYTLITNKLIIITYLLSLNIIISRIIFHLTDFTSTEIQKTYHIIDEKACEFNTNLYTPDEYIILHPTWNNACALFYWLIRFITYKERLTLQNTDNNLKYDFVEQIFYKLCNLNSFSKNISQVTFFNKNEFKNYFYKSFLIFIYVYISFNTKNLDIMEICFQGIIYGKIVIPKIGPIIPVKKNGIDLVEELKHPGAVFFNDNEQKIYITQFSTKNYTHNYPYMFNQTVKINTDKIPQNSYNLSQRFNVYNIKDKDKYFQLKSNLYSWGDEELEQNLMPQTVENSFFIDRELEKELEMQFSEIDKQNNLVTNIKFAPAVQIPEGATCLMEPLTQTSNLTYPEKIDLAKNNAEYFEKYANVVAKSHNKGAEVKALKNLAAKNNYIVKEHENGNFEKFKEKIEKPTENVNRQNVLENIKKAQAFYNKASKLPNANNLENDLTQIANDVGFNRNVGVSNTAYLKKVSQDGFQSNAGKVLKTEYSLTRAQQKSAGIKHEIDS